METVKDAIAPGSLLGVRAMTKKLRRHHDIKVPRNVVNAAMYDANSEGLEDRRPANRKKKEMENLLPWELTGQEVVTDTINLWGFKIGHFL